MTLRVEIFTDGACSGNPGPGGWGALLRYKTVEKELSGHEDNTTNNRMELTAVIEALRALKRPCNITLYTDSKYVMNGVIYWMPNWKKNGWKTATKKKEVKNIDLWQVLDELLKPHEIRWVWVKGHAGHAENERVDELARMACRCNLTKADEYDDDTMKARNNAKNNKKIVAVDTSEDLKNIFKS